MMRVLLGTIITILLYISPMTVEYTADGCSYLIDEDGDEWIYEQELNSEEVTVLLWTNGTSEKEDDIILEVLR